VSPDISHAKTPFNPSFYTISIFADMLLASSYVINANFYASKIYGLFASLSKNVLFGVI